MRGTQYGVGRRSIAGLGAILLLAVAGCCPRPIDRDQAIEILLDQVITQQEYEAGFVAYSLSRLLTDSDVLTPDDRSGRQYREPDSWFFYVDDNPEAFFGHPVRYVFIDRCTGQVTTVDEDWWPALNGTSIFELEVAGAIELTRIYPGGKSASRTDGEQTSAPEADYGDAPDDTAAGVPDGLGDFPTVHGTANSRIGWPGAHALETGQERIGDSVSRETDATDPADPDGVPNLVDNDLDDRIYLLTDRVGTDAVARLAFHVTVDAAAPELDRVVNAAADLDLSLDWEEGAAGEEWVVKNLAVNVQPGSRRLVFTGRFGVGAARRPENGFWIRVVLSRKRIDESQFAALGGWDGSGEFGFGEVEDAIFYTRAPFQPPPPKPPPPDPPPQPPPPDPPPKEDEWGLPIAYKAIIVNGGDNPEQTFVQEAADTMEAALAGQGYDIVAKLSAANEPDLGAALEAAVTSLRDQIKCVDRIFIYIVSHGAKRGALIPSRGPEISPARLRAILELIPSCKNKPCDRVKENCHLEVFLESCYAGNFAGPLSGTGRNVVTSSTADQVSWAGDDGTGGELSDEVAKAFDDSGNSGNDNSVSFAEAFEAAKRTMRPRKPQTPAGDFQECPCICPPPPHWEYKRYYQIGEEVVLEVPKEVLVELPPEVSYRAAPPGTVSHGMAATSLPPGLTLEGSVIAGTPERAGEYMPLIEIYDREERIVGEIWWYIFIEEGSRGPG